MLSFIRKLFAATPTAARKPAARRSHLGLETLEDRMVPTVVIGQLPTLDATHASDPGRSVARSDAGTLVQISEDSSGLHYRLFNSSGALQRTGTVPGTDVTRDYQPTVAMGNNGRFVVAWTHTYSYSPYDIDVRAQIFDASGNTVGTTLYVSQTWNFEDEPSAGMDQYGNFVVAYRYATSPTNHDIYAKTYNSTGGYIGYATVANGTTDDASPSAAMNRYGQYVVASTSTSGGSTSVYESTYNIYNQRLGGAWVFYGDSPSAAINAAGNVAVAFTWNDGSNDQIYIEEYNSSGQWLMGIHAGWSGENQYNPSLAMTDDGRLAVAYMDNDPYAQGVTRVYAEEYSAAGAKMGWTLQASPYDSLYSSVPTVAMSANGDFAVDYFFQSGSTMYQGDTLYHSF